MPSITSANVANAILKLVAADALPTVIGELTMGNLVRRDYEPVVAHADETVSIPTGFGAVETTLNRHVIGNFQIPDVTKVLAVPDLLKIYMQPAISVIAEKIESDLLGLYAGFTANGPLGTASTPITEAILDQAETTLFQSKVPSNAPRYLVVDSNTYSQMRQISRFSEFHNARDAGLNSLVDGSIGKLRDFFVFRSIHTHRTESACHGLAFCKEAIGLAMRRVPPPLPGMGEIAEYAELGDFGMRVTMSYQPNTLSQQFTVDVLYGCAILRNGFAVQVRS